MQFVKEWGLGIDGTARETLKRQSWGARGGGREGREEEKVWVGEARIQG